VTGRTAGRTEFLKLLGLLWLAGAAMRFPLLAVPPVIPLIHDELAMTETQVGLLIGLPLLVFAAAAVPGSLLVARLGTFITLMIGLVITALAAAARGGALNVWWLYAATVVMAFGIAIMQPAIPALVREWLPRRMALGIAVSTNGMLSAVMLAPALTIPLVLPLVGGSWRFDLVIWAAPVLAIALLFLLFAPRDHAEATQTATSARLWWPDWKDPLIWLLGITFGSNNAAYFGANAFLPDYLASQNRADLIAPALGLLNAAQLAASFVVMLMAERLQHRAITYLIFGPLTLAAFLGIMLASGNWVVVFATVVGFSTAITFAMMLALPSLLSRPGDAHRTAAGMFTISYSVAVTIPTVSGALWDLTGIPWMAFVPLCLCAIALTGLGLKLSRHHVA
jgi:CP family cyanate transporter-like MFS transporter